MNRKLDKLSGIPKPNSKTVVVPKTMESLNPLGTIRERVPLSQQVTNAPPRVRRGISPDFTARTDNARGKLRRSKSFNDVRDVPVSLKRPAPILATIPAKKFAPSTSIQPKKPVAATITTKAVATKSKVKEEKKTGGAAVKAPVKKIPPYDYKARFNALLDKHNALKWKYDAAVEELVNLGGLPERYEAAQAELMRRQEEIKSLKMEITCLESEVKKINFLTAELETTKVDLEQMTAVCRKAEVREQNYSLEIKELKEIKKILVEKNSSMGEEIHALKDQLFSCVMERKDLHNQMMDLRGNIRVFCRVRPPLNSESQKLLCGWGYLDEASLEVTSLDPKNKGHRNEFSFDQVFHPGTPQEDIFSMVAPLIQSALDGYNVCIFAYGQTGSGKTYTMDGTDEHLGIIPRTVDLLFESVKGYKRMGWQYEIRATFLEIYNEVLYDLLNPDANDLEIRMVSPTNKTEVFVMNITEKVIDNAPQLRTLMEQAKSNRATACTMGNERSSRSHAVTRLQLIGVHDGKKEKCMGTINLVDLAGSESPKTSQRMEETKKINRSLSELTNVIMAILNKQDHIPYRNSKLTYLLMPCLGGNSKTLMFVNVAPFQECYVESIKSLRFAASVNSIKINKARKNRFLNPNSM
uniref:Kinesin-like protein n=1 Tax=Phlebotomus papatasi TaxID=29031 RepID=A0A1B0DP57_PHLPP